MFRSALGAFGVVTVTLALSAAGATASTTNPCSLVTAKQVSVVVRTTVATQTLAPLGPTCIYKFKNTHRQLTIALTKGRFSALIAQIPRRQRRRVTVRGRAGVCGVLGQPILYISLPHSEVLTITASCADAKALAAIAVRHL